MIQDFFKHCINPNEPGIYFKGKLIEIEEAPEPSDILWTNCEV
jgi:hypothetical protein